MWGQDPYGTAALFAEAAAMAKYHILQAMRYILNYTLQIQFREYTNIHTSWNYPIKGQSSVWFYQLWNQYEASIIMPDLTKEI